jgi:hypothetical protein
VEREGQLLVLQDAHRLNRSRIERRAIQQQVPRTFVYEILLHRELAGVSDSTGKLNDLAVLIETNNTHASVLLRPLGQARGRVSLELTRLHIIVTIFLLSNLYCLQGGTWHGVG